MVLQSIVLPDSKCLKKELYYQGSAEIIQEDECFQISKEQHISFFSYMNMFDVNAWKKYTHVSKIFFLIETKGSGFLFVKLKDKEKDTVLYRHHFSKEKPNIWQSHQFAIDLAVNTGCCYFEIVAESDVQIRNARFETNEKVDEEHDVQIALNICTYHRNQAVMDNLQLIKKSRFYEESDELFHKLHIVIVDNGSELGRISELHIKLVHNPNTGGSGGFKRGLKEIRSWDKAISHVVFMDDDIEFHLETLYRLYALLSFIKKEYQYESIAGRMFRTDIRYVQYTAAEIWNKGDLLHIGLNSDMTLENEILQCNENADAEYGGWWFCCYPMSFAKENDPLPFFIHCDDVEYGLRHGGTPIILNGIQVWHETYEYRQSPMIAYYDIRNSLLVNELYGCSKAPSEILSQWKNRITQEHLKLDYAVEYIYIRALGDYLKGIPWLTNVNAAKNHIKLQRIKPCRIRNAIAWRIVEKKFKNKYKGVITNE